MTPTDRIKQEAERYTKDEGYQKVYIAGATATNDRAKVLVDALGKAVAKMKECEEVYNVPCGFVIEICEKALEQWEGKDTVNWKEERTDNLHCYDKNDDFDNHQQSIL